MQNKYQEKFGYPVQRTADKVKSQMAPWIQDFIRHSPFVFLQRAMPMAIVTLHRRAAPLGL
jgi:hypothetical protein